MSKSLDITNLAGADLWDAFDSDKTLKVRKTKATPKPRLLDPLAPASTQHWDWSDTHLVLIVLRSRCTCCNHEHEMPNNTIFLRREAPSGALHYTEIEGRIDNPEVRFANIEPVIEYREEEVSTCQFCFDLAYILERALKPKQPDKPEDISVSLLATPPLDPTLPEAPTGLGDDTLPIELSLDDPALDSLFANIEGNPE